MSSASYYLIESENPEKALKKIREVFDEPDLGEVFGQSRVLINRKEVRDVPKPSNDSEWSRLSDVASRLLRIGWNDTSDVAWENYGV